MEPRPPTYKICIVGDLSVGKSSLLFSLKGDDFMVEGEPLSTIGVDFWHKRLERPERVLQIWDTAGCERFLSIAKTYFRRCDLAIYCCDITNYESFKSVKRWKRLVEEECINTSELRGILVVLKSDLPNDPRITFDSISEYAYSLGFDGVFIMSNKNRIGLDKLKEYISDIPLQRFQTYASVHIPTCSEDVKNKSCCN